MALQAKWNKRIAKTRLQTEYIFAGIEQMDGKLIRTINQTQASIAMTRRRPATTSSAWFISNGLKLRHSDILSGNSSKNGIYGI